MLSSDGIHPTALGARNFYLSTLAIFPELMFGGDSVVSSAESKSLKAGSTLTLEGTPEYMDGDFGISMIADFSGSLDGTITIGTGKGVEGGTWVEIDENYVKVYRTVGGEAVLIKEANNDIRMEELVMLRIIVRNNVASIAFASSAEDAYNSKEDRKALFSVEAPWSYADGVSLSASSATLTDVVFNFVTK